MAKELDVRILNKADTSENWTNNNPVLLLGELGIETDTLKYKIGDGLTNWNNLSYVGTQTIIRRWTE